MDTIESIVFDGESDSYIVEDEVLYTKDMRTLVFAAKTRTTFPTLKDSVTTIAAYSFSFSKIEEVIIPKTITNIESNTFRSSSVRSFTFVPNIVTVSYLTFHSCSHLTTITFTSENIKEFSYNAFTGCGFVSFEVPNGLTTIGKNCFLNNHYLESVTLPESLESISGGAFSNCHENLQITFRKVGLFYIDSQNLLMDSKNTTVISYLGNKKDAVITIPSTVEKISENAFLQNINLKEIKLNEDNQLTYINANAFEGCSSLETFSSNLHKLKAIDKYAFRLCSKLSQFIFPQTIQTVSQNAFDQCKSLTKIVFSSLNPLQTITLDTNAFSLCSSLKDVDFGESYLTIGDKCFQQCKSLKTITFPSNLAKIGQSAFIETGLQSITFPESSTYVKIDDFAFYQCSYLTTINFSPNLKTIGKSAFSQTAIETLDLPKTVSTLEEGCFEMCQQLVTFTIPEKSNLSVIEYGVFQGCSELRSITSHKGNQFIVENFALFNKERTELIILPPKASVRFFYLPDTVKKIIQSSFSGCTNLITLLIPEGNLTTIEAYAFENCINLERVNLPKTINNIANNAFSGCKKLKCGVYVDNKDPNFLNSLFTNAKLPKTALKPCDVAKSCAHSSHHISRYSFLFVCFFL